MAWQSVLGTILSSLYLVLYPLVYALWGILQLLQLLATPFMNLGLKILDVSLWPFRFMARFEVCPSRAKCYAVYLRLRRLFSYSWQWPYLLARSRAWLYT